MDFALTDEQKMIQEAAREFAEKEIAPVAAHHDETRTPPLELVKKLGELGFLGMNVSDQYGGAGLDMVSYILAVEEISRACASTGIIMSVNNSLVCFPIETYGNEDQKRRYLPKLTKGEWLGAYALSEPGTGSDAANQKTMAVKDGDGYVLNGTKNFITNGGFADVFVVFAMTAPEKRYKGITAFIVEKTMPGFAVGKREKTLGIRASSTVEIVLSDCRVPAANRLGEEGVGFKVAMSTLDGGRVGVAAQAVGIARAAMEEAVQYAKQRHAFDQPIGSFQAIQWMIANMATEIDAARLLMLRAAAAKDSGQRYTTEAAMAKLFASEVAMRAVKDAVQIHGGYGYIAEFAAERHYRDAKITEIYEGTSEVQRLVIAQSLMKE